jgi:hypothetical protein
MDGLSSSSKTIAEPELSDVTFAELACVPICVISGKLSPSIAEEEGVSMGFVAQTPRQQVILRHE